MTNQSQNTSSRCQEPTTNNTVNVSFPPPENRQSYHSKNQAISRVLALKKSHMERRNIKFDEAVIVYEITPLRKCYINDMFYSEDALADMRYEAFMESCGLDPAEFE
jgi:hypothetical protein